MYRLVQNSLAVLAVLGLGLSFAGILPLNGWHMLASLAILLIACGLSNILFGKIFSAPINKESFLITALILFLILAPVSSISAGLLTAVAGLAAIASKFVITAYRRHIFNPAALGAFLIGFSGITATTWWVGSAVMLPAVIIVGLLIAKKIRRLTMFVCFLLAALATALVANWSNPATIIDVLRITIISGPAIFFGTIMLTEPLTAPPTRNLRAIYAVIAGILFSTPFHIGPVYNTPELTLLLANLFSYAVSPKKKLILTLKEKIQMAPLVWNFIFTPSEPLQFQPGQYLEWTLGHTSDNRGIRRYFTIASSPTEPDIHLGVKIPEQASSFKTKLLNLQPGDQVLAGHLSGDFILPVSSPQAPQKIVGIAGGIGITPFRSMIKYLADQNTQPSQGTLLDMVLFYACANPEEFVYNDILYEGSKAGVKTIPILSGSKDAPKTWSGRTGFITKELIEDEVEDYQNRIYYLSGPNVMVDSYKKLLRSMGISRSQIMTDYFPGY